MSDISLSRKLALLTTLLLLQVCVWIQISSVGLAVQANPDVVDFEDEIIFNDGSMDEGEAYEESDEDDSEGEERRRLTPGEEPVIKPKGAKLARARIDMNGISGRVDFSAIACEKNAIVVTVNLNGLNQRVFHYDIHESPVSKGSDPCAGVGARMETANDPAYGALSFRLGSWGLENAVLGPRRYLDNTLKLSGATTNVVGRSIVLHTQDGFKIACANIVKVS